MPRAISEALWLVLASIVFTLGVLLVLILIPLEALHDHFFPNPAMKGDPNAGED